MEYKANVNTYKAETNKSYNASTKGNTSTQTDVPSALEKIANSYTKMPDVRSGVYNIDNCNCGNCGCLQGNALLVLSPVGIAGSISAFGPFSAM